MRAVIVRVSECRMSTAVPLISENDNILQQRFNVVSQLESCQTQERRIRCTEAAATTTTYWLRSESTTWKMASMSAASMARSPKYSMKSLNESSPASAIQRRR